MVSDGLSFSQSAISKVFFERPLSREEVQSGASPRNPVGRLRLGQVLEKAAPGSGLVFGIRTGLPRVPGREVGNAVAV